MTLARAFDELASRRVLLFGGKGGVGKTTISVAAALHLTQSGREVILFTTDPASNLDDLLHGEIRTESLHAEQLYGPGDLQVTTDFRDVLSELVGKHLGNPQLSGVFPAYTQPKFRGLIVV